MDTDLDPDLTAWHLAGFADVDSAAIGRRFHDHPGWVVPGDIWVDEVSFSPKYPDSGAGRHHRLFWRYAKDVYGPRAEIEEDLLGRFVRLADAQPERIEAFSKRFGPLWRCQHGSLQACGLRRETCNAWGDEMHAQLGGYVVWSEPLDLWRQEARRARAVLSLTAAHRNRELGPIESCHDLAGHPHTYRRHVEKPVGTVETPAGSVFPAYEVVSVETVPMQPPPWREPGAPFDDALGQERAEVAEVVESWLTAGSARLGLACVDGAYQATTKADDLFGALGLQLLLTITGREGFAFCRGCSKTFAPSREHRKYCPDCGVNAGLENRRARDRERKRRQRARERDEG